MGNTLPPTEWGCLSHDGTLAPVETDRPVAPDTLLNMVSCGCKPDGCSNMTCSCNKIGLFCTSMCSKCSGQTCNNTTLSLLDVDDEDIVPSSVYYIFHEKKVVYSFVSLLDGYYRLSCKWIFNLCKDLPTPSLVLLKNLKCHGPVTNDFSYAKLKKKGHRGSYILRESARNYDEYKLDLCLDTESPPVTFIISKNDSSEYYVKGKEAIFQNVAVLRSHYHKHPILEDICLKTCIPPSEYDEMDIMLCRSSENINQQIKVSTTTENKYRPKCIPFNAVRYPSSSKYICKGRISINSLAFLNHESEKPIPAFTKSLLDFADFKLQDFLGYIETAMHWHCESIVSCIGLVVKTSTLITEYFPLGSLDLFLQKAGSELQEVDLVEAASYLARALWYLEEHNYCHGRIRCSNIFVYKREANVFKVKLGLPRIHNYTNDDMHWIPREYHDNLSLAEHTLSTDVWAFGTTLWEIFSYGQKPSSTKITKSDYRRGITLTKPENCNPNIIRLIGECWLKDPDDRKKPQAIMRDIQQTLYGVYNSRRSHLYSSMIPESFSSISINGTDSSLPPEPPPKPPTLISQKRNRSSLLKFAFDKLSRDNHDETTNLSKSGSIRGSMTSLSSSTYNESVITDITTISNTDDNSSINGSYGDICISSRNVLKDVNEAKWLLDNNHITLGTRLGQGFYGEVYMANLLLWNGLEDEVVAVKKLKDVSESAETKEQATRDLYDEIRIMKFLHHKNIVKIIGYTIEPELWLVMEYLPQGSLLNFVKQHKNELELKALLASAHNSRGGYSTDLSGHKNCMDTCVKTCYKTINFLTVRDVFNGILMKFCTKVQQHVRKHKKKAPAIELWETPFLALLCFAKCKIEFLSNQYCFLTNDPSKWLY
ncbi:Tyrosine-protein kinase JAK2 [Nymphon striatum]|nr:Tyrosine-protein kinase JAK2 [Nymphon striatum]